MIFDKRHFGAGDYVDTVGKNKKAIAEYIRNQYKDHQYEQMSIQEYIDPFTGKEEKKTNNKTALAASGKVKAVGGY